MILADLLKDVDNIREIKGSTQMAVTGIAFDSRKVKPGNLFICISGFETDGHKFAPKAVEAGASVIVAERDMSDLGVTCVVVENSRAAMAKLAAVYYGYPYRQFKLIGITGTNGKTTTTYLVKAVLEAEGHKVGLIGTNQNMVGQEIIPSKHTTPDALELMQLFKKMAEAGAAYVVMEVSSHALALDRVTACIFDVVSFTNLTQDHLDFHKTLENYLQAKSVLFRIAKVGSVNADDPASEYLLAHNTCGQMMTYGIEKPCDLQAVNPQLMRNGVQFELAYQGKKYPVSLGIPGKFSVYNALTAIACLLQAGMEIQQILSHLKDAKGVKGRVEVVETGRDFTVIIDYAHTPDGLYNVIRTIRGFAKGRVVTVFGCGGNRDAGKRPKMGKIASELSDFCVVTSDNPRNENPDAIIEDILAGVKEGGGAYAVVPNRFEAIEYALDHAQKDDIILLAGKGHETYQVLADRTIVFDEREIVHKLLDVSMV